MKTIQIIKFFLISAPLAIALLITAHIYFELKRLYNGFRVRA